MTSRHCFEFHGRQDRRIAGEAEVGKDFALEMQADGLADIKGQFIQGGSFREDTLCQASLSDAERRWLRRTRPVEASHWNLLTDLNAQFLPYAA